MTTPAIEVARQLAGTLDALGIRYVVAGSVASTLHGRPRSTLDVDFVLQLEPGRAADLERALEPEFWVSPGCIVEAAQLHSQCNAIHRRLFVKADLYVRPPTGIYVSEIERAVSLDLGEGRSVRVASAEDTVLQKLVWYRAGDEVSERQWLDVLGVLKHKGAAIDRGYLDRWARELGLVDLLEQAFADVLER